MQVDGEKKIQHNMRKVMRKKNNPQTMLLGEYSVRTGKNTSAQKHIHHEHDFATKNSSGKQPSGPAATIPALVRPACQAGGSSDGGEGSGEGR